MKCNDFRELIDSYLSDELLCETNHDVLRHMEQCADCRQVIENRREFRGRLRSAVMNSPEFQIRDEFKQNLRNTLRESVIPQKKEKKAFWTPGNAWIAAAACLIIMFTAGIWYIQSPSGEATPMPTEIVSLNPTFKAGFVEKIALGDHLGCAVNHNLEERPVKIDLELPQHRDWREGAVKPLQIKSDDYKLIEAHDCKYQNQQFTHLIFESEGKMLSVIATDIDNEKALKSEGVAHFRSAEYQMARFDVDNKAIFVISDLSKQKNSATAELILQPMRRQFSGSPPDNIVSDLVYAF